MRFCLVVCLSVVVGLCQGFAGPDDFLRRYGARKVIESCIPAHIGQQFQNQIKAVIEECRYGSRRTNVGVDPFQRPNIFETPGTHNYGGQAGIPMGFLPDSIFNLGSQGMTYINNDLLGQSFGIGNRYKRQLTIAATRTNTRNFIQSLIEGENEIRHQISNATCVLRNIGMLDGNGRVTIENQLKMVPQLRIPGDVKADVIKGAKDCEKLTRCLPASRSSLIPFHIKQAYVLLKCVKISHQISCVKKDIRDNIAQTIPQSVRGSFGIEDITQRLLEVMMAEDVNEFEGLLVY